PKADRRRRARSRIPRLGAVPGRIAPGRPLVVTAVRSGRAVTARAFFGDFAAEASRHLEHPATPVESATESSRQRADPVTAAEFARSLSGFIEVMTRYLGDVVAPDAASARNRWRVRPWDRAKTEAQEALRNAAAALRPVSAASRSDRDHDADRIRCGL